MSNPLHDELYQQALEAAKAGDRDKARELLEQLLDEDEEHVKAWLALSRVTDNIDEKRISLTTVLQIDPDNNTAQRLLYKLEEKLDQESVDEILPGVSRKAFNILAGGIIGIIVIILIIVVLVATSSSRSEANRNRDLTNVALSNTQAIVQPTQRILALTGTSQSLTETQIALVSPTPTPTATNFYDLTLTIPPTVTMTPTATVPAPVDLNLPGRLFGWSGRDILNVDNLPPVEYDLTGGEPIEIGDRLGRYISTTDGLNFIFSEYIQSSSSSRFILWDPETDEDELLENRWINEINTRDPDMLQLSLDGNILVFVADSFDTLTNEVFMVRLNPEEGEAIIEQLTNDTSNYSYPTISPDNNEIVAVRTTTEGDIIGPDLVRIDVQTRLQTPITADGDAIRETQPHFAPDGQQIVYAYIPSSPPEGAIRAVYNINIVSREGSPNFAVIEDPESNDTYPIFSPDGNYIAFTSDQTGQIELHVIERATGTVYQLTNGPAEDYAWYWLP